MTKQDCQVEEMFIEMQKEERKKNQRKAFVTQQLAQFIV